MNFDVARKHMRQACYDGAFWHAAWAPFVGGIAIHPPEMLPSRLRGTLEPTA